MILTVTHANTGEVASIIKEKVYGWYFSKSMKCVLLMSDGGGVFPIKENEDFLEKQFKDNSKLTVIKGGK